MNIQIGDVFFDQPVKKDIMGIPKENFDFFGRVLLFDSKYCYFEIWSDEKKIGTIGEFGTRKHIYHRMLVDRLQKQKKIKNIPLTDEEKKIVFIDKPIDLLPELAEYFWTSESFKSEGELIQILSGKDNDLLKSFPKIDISSFILLPFNSRDGFGKAVKLDANNGKFFTSTELLFKIHNEQSKYIKTNQTFGFKGVSRAGHQKGLPSYSVSKE